MKIEISPEEYRLLLDMLYIAEWVMSSHKTAYFRDTCKKDPLMRVVLLPGNRFYCLL